MCRQDKTPLTAAEKRLAELIPHSDDERITGAELAALTGWTVRDVRATIATMRLKGVPVIGDRHSTSAGYYVPASRAALKHGLAAVKSELASLTRVVTSLEKVDLSAWQQATKVKL